MRVLCNTVVGRLGDLNLNWLFVTIFIPEITTFQGY